MGWGGEGEAVRRCEPFTVHRVVVRGRRERGVLVFEDGRWLAMMRVRGFVAGKLVAGGQVEVFG